MVTTKYAKFILVSVERPLCLLPLFAKDILVDEVKVDIVELKFRVESILLITEVDLFMSCLGYSAIALITS